MELVSGSLFLSKISMDDLDFICRIECDEALWYYEESFEDDMNAVRKKYIQRIEDEGTGDNHDFIICLQEDGHIKKSALPKFGATSISAAAGKSVLLSCLNTAATAMAEKQQNYY
jgi:hypothetical protein